MADERADHKNTLPETQESKGDLESPESDTQTKEELPDIEILEALKRDPQKVLQVLEQASHFSGPMPPPEVMKGYNEVAKDGAERIFKNWEDQSEHRRDIEKTGQKYALFLAILGLLIGGGTAALGHPITGSVIAGTVMLAIGVPSMITILLRR
jgi:uncharacterized membrane protein